MNRHIRQSVLSAAALSLGLLAQVPAAMAQAPAPVAGAATIGVAMEEVQLVATGWSLKKQILGKTVYNDDKKAVGKVDDVIVAPDKAVSYAIVGAGGFLGMGKHDVAIPVNQFKFVDGKITLHGATKDALKALPAFEYAKHK